MKYDEDLLVELITDAELTHTEIAERVGISRRTVWSIANGHSRPDLQQKIADTVEGYQQAVVRLAAKHMTTVLARHIKEAVEGQGETARKTRDFLLTTFMKAISDEPAQAAEKRRARLQEKEHTLADAKFKHHMTRELEALYTPHDPEFWEGDEEGRQEFLRELEEDRRQHEEDAQREEEAERQEQARHGEEAPACEDDDNDNDNGDIQDSINHGYHEQLTETATTETTTATTFLTTDTTDNTDSTDGYS